MLVARLWCRHVLCYKAGCSKRGGRWASPVSVLIARIMRNYDDCAGGAVTHRRGRDWKTVSLGLSLIGLIALAYFFHVTTVPTDPSAATNGLYDLNVVHELRAGPGRCALPKSHLGLQAASPVPRSGHAGATVEVRRRGACQRTRMVSVAASPNVLQNPRADNPARGDH